MSATTPPGWYSDPSHTGQGPAPERWWDGSAWTGHTREAGTGPAVSATAPGGTPLGPAPYPPGGTPGAPPPPPFAPQAPQAPQATARRGPRAGVVVGGLALAAALVAGALALPGDGDGRPAGVGALAEGDEESGDDAREGGGSHTEAAPGGVALPILDGWEEMDQGDGAVVGIGPHPCPGGGTATCLHAGVSLGVIPGAANVSPEEYVRADIGAAESASYGEDTYGAITEREEVLAEDATFAGQDGYRVRTRIETASGTAAHVESAAFPAPDGSGGLVVIRAGFDIGDEAPPPEDIDRVVLGVRAAAPGAGTEV
ncbi:DUF2510 domain-containing protein [Streptomyces marincola]|uniref:DUF2510 domain-containing protein n=1 Tax=Streptomyces marincola TaxID=2878388 RepID=UPI00131DBA5A|nr:DUF2510 domain-containing protein [Streptomyces marincola]